MFLLIVSTSLSLPVYVPSASKSSAPSFATSNAVCSVPAPGSTRLCCGDVDGEGDEDGWGMGNEGAVVSAGGGGDEEIGGGLGTGAAEGSCGNAEGGSK